MDFSRLRNYIFLGGLAIVTILFLYLLRPLAYPVFWAAVIAGMFHPVYKSLDAHIKHENLSALLTLIMVSVIIIIPLTIIASILVQESAHLYAQFNSSSATLTQSINEFIAATKSGVLAYFPIDPRLLTDRLSEISANTTNFVIDNIKAFTQFSFSLVVMFAIMLYALFFFLRDGEKILNKIIFLLPLGNKNEVTLLHKFMSAARGALKGSLLVSIIQGGMAAILFALTGVPGAFILGILTLFLSMLPGLGSATVWLPVAIVMLLLHNYWQGILIIVIGTLVIGTIDNLLRPILVGKDSQLHPLLVLFSTLGGIIIFGISGFIIGPIIASLFLAFWEMYEQFYHRELMEN